MPEPRTDATTTPDFFLARRAAKADPRAWDEIIERYGERIFNLAYKFSGNQPEAEDLTQDIFLKLYRNLDRYRGDVPLMAWALRLSRNLCIDHYRHHRTRRSAETVSEEVLEHLPSGDDPQRHSQRRERRRLVHQVLAEMSENLASVLMLRDLQGLTYEEIAGFFEVPVGTIKSRLNRGRRELVRRVEERLALAQPAAIIPIPAEQV
ncbi:MAG: RNA polymerase sigma factor [bacterium]|nr:RNA polymerase sigma factor [bacterium]